MSASQADDTGPIPVTRTRFSHPAQKLDSHAIIEK